MLAHTKLLGRFHWIIQRIKTSNDNSNSNQPFAHVPIINATQSDKLWDFSKWKWIPQKSFNKTTRKSRVIFPGITTIRGWHGSVQTFHCNVKEFHSLRINCSTNDRIIPNIINLKCKSFQDATGGNWPSASRCLSSNKSMTFHTRSSSFYVN